MDQEWKNRILEILTTYNNIDVLTGPPILESFMNLYTDSLGAAGARCFFDKCVD